MLAARSPRGTAVHAAIVGSLRELWLHPERLRSRDFMPSLAASRVRTRRFTIDEFKSAQLVRRHINDAVLALRRACAAT